MHRVQALLLDRVKAEGMADQIRHQALRLLMSALRRSNWLMRLLCDVTTFDPLCHPIYVRSHYYELLDSLQGKTEMSQAIGPTLGVRHIAVSYAHIDGTEEQLTLLPSNDYIELFQSIPAREYRITSANALVRTFQKVTDTHQALKPMS